MTNNDWYFNGEGRSTYGFDALEDFDAAERVEAQIFVEKFRKEAPMAFEYSEPSEEQPFGSWTRKDDEFGGTSVILQVAQGTEAVPQEAYPDNFEMWVYAGEGMELGHLVADWSKVDSEIRETSERWASWSEEK